MTKMRSLSRKKTSVSTVTPSKSAAASNSITTETEPPKIKFSFTDRDEDYVSVINKEIKKAGKRLKIYEEFSNFFSGENTKKDFMIDFTESPRLTLGKEPEATVLGLERKTTKKKKNTKTKTKPKPRNKTKKKKNVKTKNKTKRNVKK